MKPFLDETVIGCMCHWIFFANWMKVYLTGDRRPKISLLFSEGQFWKQFKPKPKPCTVESKSHLRAIGRGRLRPIFGCYFKIKQERKKKKTKTKIGKRTVLGGTINVVRVRPGDAPHEGLFEVERRWFRVKGSGFRVKG